MKRRAGKNSYAAFNASHSYVTFLFGLCSWRVRRRVREVVGAASVSREKTRETERNFGGTKPPLRRPLEIRKRATHDSAASSHRSSQSCTAKLADAPFGGAKPRGSTGRLDDANRHVGNCLLPAAEPSGRLAATRWNCCIKFTSRIAGTAANFQIPCFFPCISGNSRIEVEPGRPAGTDTLAHSSGASYLGSRAVNHGPPQ